MLHRVAEDDGDGYFVVLVSRKEVPLSGVVEEH